jgi:sulfur carrier protein
MAQQQNLHFETLLIHGGLELGPVGATTVPIVQSSSFALSAISANPLRHFNYERTMSMHLTVNGKPATIEGKESLTITALLDELKVKDALYVTVELNGEVLDRPTFDSTIVKDEDTLEFLYFMGGGR